MDILTVDTNIDKAGMRIHNQDIGRNRGKLEDRALGKLVMIGQINKLLFTKIWSKSPYVKII
jgi:hypothetical protein